MSLRHAGIIRRVSQTENAYVFSQSRRDFLLFSHCARHTQRFFFLFKRKMFDTITERMAAAVMEDTQRQCTSAVVAAVGAFLFLCNGKEHLLFSLLLLEILLCMWISQTRTVNKMIIYQGGRAGVTVLYYWGFLLLVAHIYFSTWKSSSYARLHMGAKPHTTSAKPSQVAGDRRTDSMQCNAFTERERDTHSSSSNKRSKEK